MAGQHRRTRTTTAQRALAGTVPALGVAGAVTVLALSEPGVAPTAENTVDDGVDTVSATDGTGPAAQESAATLGQVPAGGPEAVSAVSGASTAVDAATDERDRERAYLTSVVDDVRADAQSRDADAAREGKERLAAFQEEQERRQQAEQGVTQPAPQAPGVADGRDRTCDLSGLPLLGGPTGPDEIVGRDCGLLDPLGQQRSGDPWIDGQLLAGDEGR